MKSRRIAALLLVSVLSVSVLVPQAFAATDDSKTNEETTTEETVEKSHHGKKESVAEPEGAIGKDAAKEKALADAGVTAEDAGKVRSHVSQTEDDTVIYKVRFTYDGQRYSYQINATTGEILDKNTKDASEITEEHSGKRGKREGMPKTETTVPTA